MKTIRYWIGVVSCEHVLRGVEGGFAQVCHGKRVPLTRMSIGDWLFYYSPKLKFEGSELCQKFTAAGTVNDANVYEFDMGNGFVPFRINISYVNCKPAAISPILSKLSFIKDIKKWGYPFRVGHFEIPMIDAHTIAEAMDIKLKAEK